MVVLTNSWFDRQHDVKNVSGQHKEQQKGITWRVISYQLIGKSFLNTGEGEKVLKILDECRKKGTQVLDLSGMKWLKTKNNQKMKARG